jgi:hypothetical protein
MTNLSDTLADLARALDRLADALTSGSPDAVLAAEEPVRSAVTRLAAFGQHGVALPEARGVRSQMHAVQAATVRCERLGRAARDYVRATFGDPAYGRAGRPATLAAARRLSSVF